MLQLEKWDPIYKWFTEKFNIELPLSNGIIPPHIPEETNKKLREFLDRNNFEAVQGMSLSEYHVEVLCFQLLIKNLA